ncbi:MAG TPA: hypothetical protein VLC94_09540, partial [Candidatus Acidoferrum sp.]|nr:hypothetical protein [Candidatus Acidoferrum sp.]
MKIAAAGEAFELMGHREKLSRGRADPPFAKTVFSSMTSFTDCFGTSFTLSREIDAWELCDGMENSGRSRAKGSVRSNG